MTEVSTSIEVPVDPAVAFEVFTGEMNLWFVRSPIAFYDSARAVAIRCEAGVGGRILEEYEDGSFEIARITSWEPGEHVRWSSAHDDVETDVSFDAIAGGTRVKVVARVPDDGADRGGSSFTRTLHWFGGWVGRRDEVAHEVVDLARLNLQVFYERPVAAMRWLAAAFGFPLSGRLPDDDSARPPWIETRIGTAALVIRPRDDDAVPSPTVNPFVYVDDLDAHFERASSAGAVIVEPIHSHGYRIYVCEDPEGVRWTFAQARPTMRDPRLGGHGTPVV